MTPNRTRAAPARALLALLATVSTAAAQPPEQEMVPLELAQLFSAGFGGPGLPELLVGRLPEDMSRVIPLPDDARIVGAVVRRRSSVGALAQPAPPAEVRAAWGERLLAAGWRRFEPPVDRRSGFQSTRSDPGFVFCLGDSVTLNVGVIPNPRGGSYVILAPRPSGRGSPCAMRDAGPRAREEYESLIPSLEPPEGSRTVGMGSGRGGDEQEARARVDTGLTAEELVEHYGAQLRAYGWTPVDRTATSSFAIETFRVTDSEGDAWHGLLIASAPSPESERLLLLRLNRVQRRR